MISHTSQTSSRNELFSEPPSRLRLAAMWASAQAAAGLQNVCGNRCSDGFGILMYHRVADHIPGVEAPTCNVTPARLRQQLSGLLARGFECWPLSRLVESGRKSRPIPANAFAVTFDDGYANNYLHAWPILNELEVPATIFLATKYLDTDRPFPFDDWPATGTSRVPESAWRPLTTAQCEELFAGGLVELGAHTHSHGRYLGRVDEFRRDMTVCLDVLRDRFGIERPAFAFPFGDKSAELVEAAQELGVTCSLSIRPRRVEPGDDVYEWGRFWAGASDTPAILAAKLSGWYTAVAMAGKALVQPLAGPSRAIHQLSSRCLSSGSYCGATEAPSHR